MAESVSNGSGTHGSNGNGDDSSTRAAMKDFWDGHCTTASLQDVMLDSKAKSLDESEKPEILAMLPALKGMRVLELGAGIGRYTGTLAETAQHVTSVDFVEQFVEKNRQINGVQHPNITFVSGDAMKLDYEENSFDIVFSNWLLMYISDAELEELTKRMLRWVKVGGHVFFRESCFRQSGDRPRDLSNPTKYRDPKHYHHTFETAYCESAASATACGFELDFSRCVRTYLQMKNNPHQMCWSWSKVIVDKKTKSNDDFYGFQSMRQFLDQQQYSVNGILRYEKMFGKNYVSTGGPETTAEFVPMLKLQEGEQVMDVGSGLGGGALYMAENYGVDVLGLDLSTNMVHIALARAVSCSTGSVLYEVSDITKRQFPDESFDVIYSRDTLLHIPNKAEVFKKFFRWLKPGGRILISDYCCGEGEWSDSFKTYVEQRHYTLHSVKHYGQILRDAGFAEVVADDRSRQFCDVLLREVKRASAERSELVKEFSEKDYDDLVTGWKAKVERVNAGDQCWGLFFGRKLSA
ncbi:uncharacterized protein LOC135815686 [Sycon ciliatum]|uniref:uncharacterized protein LOC135815686 n=1 Tax=Sycon ciliatum TaxID=27933 RepID=UPI0020ABD444|eukprot:scpid57393/ scgid28246/ Phosphoethanolamine N-methyltransferase 3